MSFWAIFCPFTPQTAGKMKISQKWKKNLEILSFTQMYQNHDHMLCCFWDMACDTCNFYFSFWATFCPFIPPYQPKKSKLQKMKKNPLEISSFYRCVPKIMIRWCMVPEIGYAMDERTDGQTDGKSDKHRWMPHLKTVEVGQQKIKEF